MISIKHFLSILMGLLMLLLCACGEDRNGWQIQGTIDGGADSTLYIEAQNLGNWYVIDSVKISNDGKVSYQALAPDSLETIYRMRLGRQTDYIYFPIQGTQTLEFKAKSKGFSRNYTLTGTPAAKGFARVDALINGSIDKLGPQGALTSKELRTELDRMINTDTTCIVSYYIINKHIGPKLLYDFTVSHDLAMLGNAANNYSTTKPNDPRAKELEQRYLTIKKELAKQNNSGIQIDVPEEARLGRPTNVNLNLYNAAGQLQNFDNFIATHKYTLLNLTCYQNPASTATNIALNTLIQKYGKQGLGIYQIDMDPDELTWHRTAPTLPWTSVWADPDQATKIMMAYNADVFRGTPVTYLLNAQGNIIKRIPADELKTALDGLM